MAIEEYDKEHVYAHARPKQGINLKGKKLAKKNYEWEPLEDHLIATAKLAEKYGNKFGAGKILYALGLMHDLGKMSKTFQTKLVSSDESTDHVSEETTESSDQPKPVDHVLVGALVNYTIFYKEDDFLVNAMSAIIQGHHDSIDCMMYFDNSKYEKKIMNAEYKDILEFADKLGVSKCKIDREVPVFKPNKNSIQKMMYVRMLYSCLRDADNNVTKNFQKRRPYAVLPSKINSFYVSKDGELDEKHKACAGVTIENFMEGLYSDKGMIQININPKKTIPLRTIINSKIYIEEHTNLKDKEEDFKWLFVISMNELFERYKCTIYLGKDELKEKRNKTIFRQLKEYVDLDKNFDDFHSQKLTSAIENQDYEEVHKEIMNFFPEENTQDGQK